MAKKNGDIYQDKRINMKKKTTHTHTYEDDEESTSSTKS